MNMKRAITLGLASITIAFALAMPARADDLRNVKRGEPIPACKLPTLDASVVDSDALKGSVVVMVCVSANQRRSELAAMESSEVVREFAADHVKLVHVTADVVQKADFEKFRKERGIDAPLAFDADRAWYAKLGLIVFPTTVIISKEGKLANVISLHGGDYKHTLEAYIKHACGKINDEQLHQALEARASDDASPKSLASAHRALARSLREKGRLDAAKEELNKAREQDPENREIMLDFVELDIQMNNLDGADVLVDQVLKMQPDHRRAKQFQGIILYRRGNIDAAMVSLEESLKLNPSPEYAHYYLGRIYESKGDSAKAMEHYREALRHFVHDTDAPKDTQTPAK